MCVREVRVDEDETRTAAGEQTVNEGSRKNFLQNREKECVTLRLQQETD